MSDVGMRITVFLGVIGALAAAHLWLGSRAADLAEKKGYSRPFGFLMGFYFSVVGYFVLTRMKPDEEELRQREREKRLAEEREQVAELEGRKETPAPFRYEYKARRPSFPAAYALLGAALGASLFLSTRGEDLGGRGADLNLIPRASLAGWKYMGDAPQDPEASKQVMADATTLRYYQSPTGQLVELYLVYRRYGRREFNHNPDQCFPAGGYRLLRREVTPVPWGGGEREAVHMVFDGAKVLKRDGTEGVPQATVSYLFASGKKTEHVFLKQQMWMALERIVPNKNGWALIRLTTPDKTGDADALAAQKEFLKVYGPEIEKAITTDHGAGDDTAAAARPPPDRRADVAIAAAPTAR